MIAGIAVLVVAFVLVEAALFTVDQTEQVLITQFGNPVRVITKPGLWTKTPFVQTVITFDKRLLNLELPGEQVILGDQRRLVVDSYNALVNAPSGEAVVLVDTVLGDTAGVLGSACLIAAAQQPAASQ